MPNKFYTTANHPLVAMKKGKPSLTSIENTTFRLPHLKSEQRSPIPPFHLNSPYNCSMSVCFLCESLYAIQLDTLDPVTRLVKFYSCKSKVAYCTCKETLIV